MKDIHMQLGYWAIYLVMAPSIYFMKDDSSTQTVIFMTILWVSISIIWNVINWATKKYKEK